MGWFLWIGAALLPLAQVWPLYRRRYGNEHGLRFDKQNLLDPKCGSRGWLEPHVGTPEQFQRWTDLVGIVRNELVLGRPEVEALRQSWESRARAATPRQVRRVMRRNVGTLGTPAQPPRPRGKSPGRARGAKIKRARRYVVVYKGAPQHDFRRKLSEQQDHDSARRKVECAEILRFLKIV